MGRRDHRDRFIDFKTPTSVGLGCYLLDATAGAAPTSPAAPPNGLSGEVMEDVQGKKVVFRNGWEPYVDLPAC